MNRHARSARHQVPTRSVVRRQTASPTRRAVADAKAQEVADVINSLRRLFKAIQEYSKRIFRRTGLSGPQVWALNVLEQEPGLSHGDLAERLFAHTSTVSGIVDRLEDRGVVARVTDPDDRRGVRLSLTPLGQRLVKRSPPPVQLGLRRALEGLPTAQLRKLRRVLLAVVQQTAAAALDAPFFDVGVAPRQPRKRRRAKRER